MPKKTSSDSIQIFYDESDFQLIAVTHERQYGKALRWMVEHVCPKGHQEKKRWRGEPSCSKCVGLNNGARVKISTADILSYLEENAPGYALLEHTMQNKSAKIKVSCPENHTYDVALSDFKKGRRCQQCFMSYGNPKVDREIQQFFASNKEGYKLLDIHRVRRKYLMAYITVECPQGHTYDVHWNKFKGGDRDAPRRCHLCNGSYGEKEIARILINHGKTFKPEFWFDDCRDKYPLPFDFAVFEGNEITHLIEFDGEQHFNPVCWGGMTLEQAEIIFADVIRRDKIKNQYCLDKGINLIRIPYWEIAKIEKILREVNGL